MSEARSFSNILVTGGAGFIGSNFIHYLFADLGFSGRVVNLDALTYAGNPQNLSDIAAQYKDRYVFVHGDIRDAALVQKLFADYNIDAVVHFAAESHVDRSILDPQSFITTNVMGTYTLLEAARQAWKGTAAPVLFHHISTDEVYGSLGEEGAFKETTPYDPRSPYSASKASSDFFVKAYSHTYGLPITISNCSNNYGPYQFPEKLIPLMILNMLEGKPLPIYGDGKNIRDWLYVVDHNAAVWTIMTRGTIGETYNIGGENEWENIRLLHRLIEIVAEETGNSVRELEGLITFVKDRPGHDRRYAIDCSKLKNELGWKQSVSFDEGLRHTVRWYLDNPEWIASVRSGAYRAWIATNYENRA
ncbi:MAG: dTDP-glucose 4,6-dehydratase [Spirochaetes bacterium ADurb.Bin110]|nr:MAG: dTDP-glucose 4,6-dehydratase [Spirochaetes bacterium ADurb.Bin110]